MRQGAPADLKLLAYHEAGHAVVACVLKRPLSGIALRLGRVAGDRLRVTPLREATLEERERDVMVLMAGLEAEALLTGDYDWWSAEPDRERAESLIRHMVDAGHMVSAADEEETELIEQLSEDPMRSAWTLLRHRTHKLVHELPVHSAVTALAAAVLVQGELDAQQAQRVIRQGIASADPDLLS
jgi:ATP-dependent Zn protease